MLRCQYKGIKCPPYKHQGIFISTNEIVTSLWPDMQQCAACTAFAAPKRPDFQDDLVQVAAETLIEKGPAFNPAHHSGASFGTFIRPRICGALMNEKSRELTHNYREPTDFEDEWDPYEDPDAEGNEDVGRLWAVPDPPAEFEENLVRDISLAAALPTLLKTLTPRERDVFACLRDNQPNCEIAKALALSQPRVSQLVKQVTQKLASAAQRLGLAE